MVYTKSMTTTTENLTDASPVEIDTVLAGIWTRAWTVAGYISQYDDWLRKEHKTLETARSEHVARRSRETVSRYEDTIAGLRNKRLAILSEADPYTAEFDRRGGWERAFLVVNSKGHVHRDMSCSTCRPTTKFNWVTDFSGANEDDIIAAAGERACSVCYPDAPVEAISRPTSIFSPEEKEKAERQLSRLTKTR